MSDKIKKNLMSLLLMFFPIFSNNYCYAVAVGELYGGGTVFCVSQTPDITQCVPEGSGDYGLIKLARYRMMMARLIPLLLLQHFLRTIQATMLPGCAVIIEIQ
jgi:hypothetical protein